MAKTRPVSSSLKRSSRVALVAAAIVVGWALPAWASCQPGPSFARAVQVADAVWVGTTVAAHPDASGPQNWRLTVQVENVIKGGNINRDAIIDISFSQGGPVLPSDVPKIRHSLVGATNVFTVEGPSPNGTYRWKDRNDGCGFSAPANRFLAAAGAALGHSTERSRTWLLVVIPVAGVIILIGALKLWIGMRPSKRL